MPQSRMLQMCDITDSLIRNLILGSRLRSTVDSNDGWFESEDLNKIRKVLRLKLLAIEAGRYPDMKAVNEVLTGIKLRSKSATEEDQDIDDNDGYGKGSDSEQEHESDFSEGSGNEHDTMKRLSEMANDGNNLKGLFGLIQQDSADTDDEEAIDPALG